MKVEIQQEWYSSEQCAENPKKLYVFGDNLKRVGKGGQAQIRDEPNTYGIATKRLPSMSPESFFSDRPDEAMAVYIDIIELFETATNEGYETIVLPAAGLGSGLSRMPEYSPKLFNWIHQTLSLLVGLNYKPTV